MESAVTAAWNVVVTLIKVVVVIALLELSVALVGPKPWSNVDTAKVTAAHAELQQLAANAKTFKLDKGRFPTNTEGIEALRPYIFHGVPMGPSIRLQIPGGSRR